MKMNIFLITTIGICILILLYAITTIAWPELDTFNWILSTACGLSINIGLVTSQKKSKS